MREQPTRSFHIPPDSSSPRRVTSTGLAELLDLSPDALLIVDQAGTILQVNVQATALFGYPLAGHAGTAA